MLLRKWFQRRSSHHSCVRVLFVCTANVCRSPLAEALLRHQGQAYADQFELEVDSCGIQAGAASLPPDPRARKVAQQAGVSLKGIKSRKLERRDFYDFDLILAMDRGHLQVLKDRCPEDSLADIQLLGSYRQSRLVAEEETPLLEAELKMAQEKSEDDIPDPYYGNQKSFHRVFELLQPAVAAVLTELSQSTNMSQ